MTAEPKAITPQLEAFGEIKSRRTLDLRLALGGQVTGLSDNFVDGGQVKSGEKLVEIDDLMPNLLFKSKSRYHGRES